MDDLDVVLYKWISAANRKREDLDLPVGLIEESVSLLKSKFGPEYLTSLLIRDTRPVAIFDEESRLLRTWLLSGRVASHILQVLELAAYFSAFSHDVAWRTRLKSLREISFGQSFLSWQSQHD